GVLGLRRSTRHDGPSGAFDCPTNRGTFRRSVRGGAGAPVRAADLGVSFGDGSGTGRLSASSLGGVPLAGRRGWSAQAEPARTSGVDLGGKARGEGLGGAVCRRLCPSQCGPKTRPAWAGLALAARFAALRRAL